MIAYRIDRQPIDRRPRPRGVSVVLLLSSCILVVGCDKMADQPHQKPLAASTFYEDGASARPLVKGVVPRDAPLGDDAFNTGSLNGKPVDNIPMPIDAALLARGRERFNIFCSPCHSRLGDGRGMVALRGFPHPPSYYDDRLRQAPAGHFFDVISHGFGRMAAYDNQLPPGDRWAVIAYIRALQLSQHAAVDQLDADDRRALEARRD